MVALSFQQIVSRGMGKTENLEYFECLKAIEKIKNIYLPLKVLMETNSEK